VDSESVYKIQPSLFFSTAYPLLETGNRKLTTAKDPALSPQIVTASLSPPNAPIFSCTHRSANRISLSARLVFPLPWISSEYSMPQPPFR
jgi:hypothetical protein